MFTSKLKNLIVVSWIYRIKFKKALLGSFMAQGSLPLVSTVHLWLGIWVNKNMVRNLSLTLDSTAYSFDMTIAA